MAGGGSGGQPGLILMTSNTKALYAHYNQYRGKKETQSIAEYEIWLTLQLTCYTFQPTRSLFTVIIQSDNILSEGVRQNMGIYAIVSIFFFKSFGLFRLWLMRKLVRRSRSRGISREESCRHQCYLLFAFIPSIVRIPTDKANSCGAQTSPCFFLVSAHS